MDSFGFILDRFGSKSAQLVPFWIILDTLRACRRPRIFSPASSLRQLNSETPLCRTYLARTLGPKSKGLKGPKGTQWTQGTQFDPKGLKGTQSYPKGPKGTLSVAQLEMSLFPLKGPGPCPWHSVNFPPIPLISLIFHPALGKVCIEGDTFENVTFCNQCNLP